ncbi:hypothetical protein CAC42_3660 [Sphaceloma murrayae]|uniref:Uncharacterized protein n=1 Tax=Sphaceloma murrayae TaxID=2082308 RepID=A0A2K1QQ88_9PEZI|nr:hypothetical protein CAC42_3660 [Sphaceloma murrayae]
MDQAIQESDTKFGISDVMPAIPPHKRVRRGTYEAATRGSASRPSDDPVTMTTDPFLSFPDDTTSEGTSLHRDHVSTTSTIHDPDTTQHKAPSAFDIVPHMVSTTHSADTVVLTSKGIPTPYIPPAPTPASIRSEYDSMMHFMTEMLRLGQDMEPIIISWSDRSFFSPREIAVAEPVQKDIEGMHRWFKYSFHTFQGTKDRLHVMSHLQESP